MNVMERIMKTYYPEVAVDFNKWSEMFKVSSRVNELPKPLSKADEINSEYNKEKLFKLLPVLIIFFILFETYAKCEEINNNVDELSFLPFIHCPASTPEGITSYMEYMKYLGPGSGALLLSVIIVYYKE